MELILQHRFLFTSMNILESCCIFSIFFREAEPLALYAFSKDYQMTERLSKEILSGGFVVNDMICHYQGKKVHYLIGKNSVGK